MPNFSELISQWDAQIRAGQLDEVRAALKKVPAKSVERRDMLEVAKICRRVHMYSLAIKVLFPVIRGEEGVRVRPTVEEVAEYAASLLRMGSVTEVQLLLANPDLQNVAEVSLYRAFAQIVEWNHAAAIDSLVHYLKFPTLTDYQRRVAEVNLALSYIECDRFVEGATLLQRLILDSKRLNQHLIYATCLCHLGHLYVRTNEVKLAHETLNQAREAVAPSAFQHHLLVDNMATILEAQTTRSPSALARFHQIKERARKLGVYEVLRDCDFAKAQWYDDENAFNSVFVGTSYSSFREKCLRLQFSAPIEITYSKRDLGDVQCSTESSPDAFDMSQPSQLDPGKIIYRALAAFNQDFYRPQSFGGLYEFLYPDTYFDPFSAKARVHQTVGRLRSWIEQQELQWKIPIDKRGLVFLNGGGPKIRIPTNRSELRLTPEELLMVRIFASFGTSEFRFESLLETAMCSRSQAYYCLQSGVASGRIVKFGKGRYTQYRFIKHPFYDQAG